ncbi:protein adenylyltransferase SelO [Aquirhabdus parva]|uniref:Protein nucleotidyltransferase YdiU n=1 Tax=Aquirhabdus parva TaxID=2283318 RepID=A0A345P435_9GAMM|nr:YdiU family protein [Aquirhabdus parva]AXI02044.1 YdiU family protein [Aquirhabdus parva]
MNIDNRYALLDPRLFHKQPPKPLKNPIAGHFNHALASQLGWQETEPDQWVPIIAGETLPDGFDPLAMVYAGHQFGHWAGQLGDGRGLLLAQVIDQNNTLQDLHLKGVGLTPYSRMGDGRAVLRSVIREYLAGHALSSLGIASSNALGFISSDTPVQRETLERGACLLRVADSHVRLGHFEWINRFAADVLPEFTHAMIETYYPECLTAESPTLAFARAVIQRTAKMIADWQLVGFAHGVMNTDNLNITGSTLDFGPYGFMERFEPTWINNHSDSEGRYVYQNQPSIAHWNLWVWLGQLLPLGSVDALVTKESLSELLATFEPEFLHYYTEGMAKKFGLHATPNGILELSSQFLRLLEKNRLDYTNSFRLLSDDTPQGWISLRDEIIDIFAFDDFAAQYKALVEDSERPESERKTAMDAANPRYILRNHMAQIAIEHAEAGDFSEVARLFDLLSTPYTNQPDRETPSDISPLPDDKPPVNVSCSS